MRAAFGWQSEAGHRLRFGYRYNRDPGSIFESFLGRGSEFDAPSNTRVNKVNQINLATYIVATRYLELFADGLHVARERRASTAGGSASC